MKMEGWRGPFQIGMAIQPGHHQIKSTSTESKVATFSHAASPQRAQQIATISAIAAVNAMKIHRVSIKPPLIPAPNAAPATRPRAKCMHLFGRRLPGKV